MYVGSGDAGAVGAAGVGALSCPNTGFEFVGTGVGVAIGSGVGVTIGAGVGVWTGSVIPAFTFDIKSCPAWLSS